MENQNFHVYIYSKQVVLPRMRLLCNLTQNYLSFFFGGVGVREGFVFEQGGVFFLLLQYCAFMLLVCSIQR